MNIVIAALDASAAARPVLDTALAFAEMTGSTVEAVTVDGASGTVGELAERAAVPLRRVAGPAEQALLEAVAAPHVIAGVLGARGTPGGRRPTGRTALHVLEHASKPIVIVPPDAVAPRSLRRLLLPLEGTVDSSQPILDTLRPLLVGDIELIALHVFTDATMPRVLDHPGRDLELLGAEFLTRHCPDAARIELRTGPPGSRVAEVCAEQRADLVVLSWSQDASPGHAAVIREVLGHASIPVLLLPIAQGNDPHDSRPVRATTRSSR